MNRPIGGYFELEYRGGIHYHLGALKLNSGRNCLKYILSLRKYRKIFLPYYTCEVILQPIKSLNIDYEFYSIDKNLDPIFEKELSADEAFLYTNYYGIKQKTVIELSKKIRNLIVDNAQAFFSLPINGIDTFYSARKFFGVPDGAYLYIADKDFSLNISEYEEVSFRMKHLLVRHEKTPQDGYLDFLLSEKMHDNTPIRYMSKISNHILESLDYSMIKLIRYNNFMYLHKNLHFTNRLNLNIEKDDIPMVYPYFTTKKGLREFLIHNDIFVPKYWENVYEWTHNHGLEVELTTYLIPLPIDQRYSIEDMNRIVKTIEDYHEI